MTLRTQLKNELTELFEAQRVAILENNLSKALCLEEEIGNKMRILKVIK
ncbi:MAG: hypothetical protein ACTSWU_00890 [Candidatus Thorarchaeota archaeon]